MKCWDLKHLTLNPQAMGLLQHLKSYTRVSPPTDVENTHLLETGLLPNSLSSSRLPFHLLMQTKHYWKIICKLTTVTFSHLSINAHKLIFITSAVVESCYNVGVV